MKAVEYTIEKKVKAITWLLAFYFLLAPLDFLQVVPGESISKLLVMLPLGASIFYIKNMKVRIDRFYILLILFIMMIIISMFYSYDQSATVQRTISVTLNIAVILILSMINYNKYEIKILKRAMVLSGWLTIFLMIIYSHDVYGRLTVVVNGAYQDPNYLTGFLIFSIVYYIDEFISKKKLTSLIKTTIFLTFVLLTGSRGGTIAILGSLLFYIFAWMKSKRVKSTSFVVIIGLIFVLGVFFNLIIDILPSTVAQRYDMSFTVEDGAAGRLAIWKNILYNYKQVSLFHNFFGMGAGTIKHFAYGHSGHNIWIESLMEIGLVGVTILFAFYFTYILKAYKMGEYVVFACFMGYMIMTLSMSLYSYKPIWNILLMIMVLKNNSLDSSGSVSRTTLSPVNSNH